LKSRDRVLMALNHEEPDRVPIDLGGSSSSMHLSAYTELTRFLSMPATPVILDRVQQIVVPDEGLLRRFEVDTRWVRLRDPRNWQFREFTDPVTGRVAFVDEWGVKWGRSPLYYDMIDHPLKDAKIEDIDHYKWPSPNDPGRTEGLRDEAKKLFRETDYALVVDWVYGGLFEVAWWLRGFEKFMVDMLKNHEFAEALLDKLLEMYKGFYAETLSAIGDYVQIVAFGDDYGMQSGPMLSPALFRRYMKPRLRELFDFVHSQNDAKIFLHSDGSVYPFIEDLIEAGLDVLSPIQPQAAMMDATRLKKEFGDRICFHGGLDIQNLLPFGSPCDVSREVARIVKVLSSRGGYIFACAHNIQAKTPVRNVCAAFDTARSTRLAT